MDRHPLPVRQQARGRAFPAALLAFLLALLALCKPDYAGDVVEYALQTVALADHGGPDIRLPDIARARALAPALAPPAGALEEGMRAGSRELYAAFIRGRHGDVYAIHFFGYPLLAALPYKLFEALGVQPFKAFQAVNFAAVFVLGLALRRFFGSSIKAVFGLALFFGCGGALYANWTSPECLSAAALLAALLLYLCGAPLAGGLLGGLAGWQNPTIVFFFAFAPLLKLVLDWRAGAGLAANLKAQLTRANLAGIAAGAALYALPPLFNLYEYGVPNIIARKFSDPSLIGPVRLVSFYFDLNQGMVLAIPGVLALLLCWGWGRGLEARRNAALLGACLLFTLALALPALAVQNWNSGAAGVMRYAFWAAMPILLALLLRLRARPAWTAPGPRGALALLALVQAGAMVHLASYQYHEFSPLARFVLAHFPYHYHPEPEIFAERMAHNDDYIWPDKAYVFAPPGGPRKTLYTPSYPDADSLVCGPGAMLAEGNRTVDSAHGWRYIDGPVRCRPANSALQVFRAAQFRRQAGIALAQGWNAVETNGGTWDGVWSQGPRSRLLLPLRPGMRPTALSLLGNYLEGNARTRVRVNGVDLGWQRLDRGVDLALPALPPGAVLTVEFEHEAPHAPGGQDPRLLALFLREVGLREAMPQQ